MSAMGQAFRELTRRVQLMLSIGAVRLVNSDAHAQRLQISVLKGETLDHVELREPYGFTAHPHPGSEVLVGSVGGQRSHTVAICAGGRMYRLKGLAEGEVAIYDDLGQAVELRRDGIHITASTVTVHGDATVVGEVSASGDVEGLTGGSSLSLDDIRTVFNAHTHVETGGTTAPPGAPM